ncbi:MAG: VWA domain-containing protein [Alphaproteobacteria bacterium]|jgi:Ca-activated chloride channel family protein|nr:VWA domain-containing protein [Alphaproteobacteria bacterium]
MILANPAALLLLLLIPPLLLLARRLRARPAIGFPEVGTLANLAPAPAARLRRLLPALRVLALIACVIALARPQWGLEMTKVYSKGIAIAMVVDVSSSMGALDLTIDEHESNRLDVVKETFRAFVEGGGTGLDGREGDLIGMVSFARYADSLNPLTLDHKALVALLDQLEIVNLPEEDGTAIGEAIILGVERLRRASGTSRVMILLTDGSNNAGDTDPVQAAQVAEALDIKIYTIGTGTRGTAMIPIRESDGREELRPTQVFIDEYTLEQVARLTGGRYFRATDGEALRSIYAEIDRLEEATHVAEHYQKYIDAFPALLALALTLLVAEATLANTRLRTVP